MATQAFEAIVDDFEFLESWEDRYRYIIDLGKRMSALEEGFKSPSTKVEGCASQVWIMPQIACENGQPVFSFSGDSDAIIVRGLIAVLSALYNGVALDSVAGIDAAAELERLGLRDHLTAQRSNGLTAMIMRIHRLATHS